MRLPGSPRFWVRVGLLLLCVSVRLAALNADPPPWLSWSTGLYTDEGYYTLDARHKVLFGTLAPGNFHDRLLSPLLSITQQGVFEVFGAGLLQARLLNVCIGLVTIAVFWLGLRRAYDSRTADLGALFLGLAPVFALYNRVALQETPTIFWLVLAFALWVHGGRLSGLLAGISLGLAIVFKGLAIIALPALLAGGPPAPNNGGAIRARHEGAASPSGQSARSGVNNALTGSALTPPLLGAGGTLLLYFLLWYAPHHAELARMATYYRVHQMQPHSAVSVWLNLKRGLIGSERGVIPYLLALLPVPCLLAAGTLRKWRQRTAADRYFTIWLVSGLLLCLVSSYAPSRYYVLFLPPVAGLAARGLAGWNRTGQIAIAGLFLLTSSVWYGLAWTGRTETRFAASRELTRLLPPGSVVIGEFAPTLCLGTPFAAAPVQPGLSNDDHPVERLHATDVAVSRTVFWRNWWAARYPGILQPSHKVATFTLGGPRRYVVDVYRVKK